MQCIGILSEYLLSVLRTNINFPRVHSIHPGILISILRTACILCTLGILMSVLRTYSKYEQVECLVAEFNGALSIRSSTGMGQVMKILEPRNNMTGGELGCFSLPGLQQNRDDEDFSRRGARPYCQ